MIEAIQVMTTTEKKEDAERIAGELVGKRLAACVQILGPITSIYHWQGRVENAQEWLCLIKTRRSLYEDVERAIKGVHPYQTPEILASPILVGHRPYLEWLEVETRAGQV